MSKLMLIDATHPEETRVAVVADGQIEDFDFEARSKRQLRGNIYLAKVTRVEPSLQAAFVDYGGNRHGFLAFSEIHPDYYQIPKEDREALMAEAAREDEDESGDEDDDDSDDENDRATSRRNALFQRKYKIQEVIRRRQVLLVQAVKEERGNKGAALTTYLSLAGRYCVLMPNTARGGGISRKITNANDRKRLKAITSEFEVPRGAGLIVRTAGAKRTKTEIRRDFEYLTKLWQQIVGTTMESMAPALIHEEGHLVLRAVRDLYDKDIEQIVVEGSEAWEEARNFVKMLMPSHARKVVQHTGSPPLFVATGVEDQLDNIFSPIVHLPSGGYIVINQAEALVAIDVNSGKATRERNVENTALKTNLEAATEACRQMRLRDLAGLIVIDFIDMEESKNNRAVEKRMKDALKIDRARVQTGRISQFGLFEISRQRRRAGVLELSSEVCSHCSGTGRVRSVESAALQLLRAIEARANDDRVDTVHVEASPEVALFILNEKRSAIARIESNCHVHVRIEANDELKNGEFEIESRAGGEAVPYRPIQPIDIVKLRPLPPPGADDEIEEEEEDADLDAEGHEDHGDHEAEESVSGEDDAEGEDDDDANRRRGRRGGRRRRNGRPSAEAGAEQPVESARPERNEERGNGGRKRRGRGGRDRDRDRERTRVPDIATDGGEMLDAIASAPFLLPAAAAPADEEFVAAPANDAIASPAEAAEAVFQPETVETPAPEPVMAVSEPDSSPDFAASSAESAPEPAAPKPAASVEVQAPVESESEKRHRIHGDPVEPAAATEPESGTRRMGWWSRRKTG